MDSRELGLRIRRARERKFVDGKPMSQEHLAKAVGAGVRSVGRWERGEAVPRSHIGTLEDVLGVNLTDEPCIPQFTDPNERELWETVKGMDIPEDQRQQIMETYRRNRDEAAARRDTG